ncbi:MAG TPA: hypothetical protein VII33_15180, partial [Nakamurella sp.]
MHELQVLITPSAVPCSSTGDPSQNPDMVTLQISVLNIAGVPVNLTGSALRFDFIVDPGGTDSAGALILSSNSVTPTGTPPTPIQAVHAAAVAGTAWSISAAQDSPCAFIALPQPGAAIIAPQASISFTFANLLVDLVPGATPVAVTVLPAAPI